MKALAIGYCQNIPLTFSYFQKSLTHRYVSFNNNGHGSVFWKSRINFSKYQKSLARTLIPELTSALVSFNIH